MRVKNYTLISLKIQGGKKEEGREERKGESGYMTKNLRIIKLPEQTSTAA